MPGVAPLPGPLPERVFPRSGLKACPLQTIRARADRKAFWSRYHDPACHEAMGLEGPGKRLMLTALERGRIRAIGSKTFPGAGQNMAEHVSLALNSLTLFEHLEALAFARLARDHLWNPAIVQSQTGFDRLDHLWERLAAFIEDQEAFAREALAFLNASPETDDLLRRLAAEADRVFPDMAPMPPEALFHQEMQPDVEESPSQETKT